MNNRRLFDRLPNDGYKNNAAADAITYPWDTFTDETLENLEDIINRQLNPLTCDESWLDYLAVLSGFTGLYWSKSWDTSIKRQLIGNAYSLLWAKKGTKEALSFVLALFLDDNFDIWTPSSFIVNRTELPGEFGKPEYAYYIRLKPSIEAQSSEYLTGTLINHLFGAAYCDSNVVYDGFYINQSKVGDPVFDSNDGID